MWQFLTTLSIVEIPGMQNIVEIGVLQNPGRQMPPCYTNAVFDENKYIKKRLSEQTKKLVSFSNILTTLKEIYWRQSNAK